MFLAKYGAQFPAECVQACCVNQKLLSILSRPVPSEALINFYLSWIANKHHIDWDPPVHTTYETQQQQQQQLSFCFALSLSLILLVLNSIMWREHHLSLPLADLNYY
jgi:hypothetical protein